MNMIIIKTKMKKIPDKCSDCKFSHTEFRGRCCDALSHKLLDTTFVKEKNNWTYVRPRNCPLEEVEDYNEKSN